MFSCAFGTSSFIYYLCGVTACHYGPWSVSKGRELVFLGHLGKRVRVAHFKIR